MSAEVAVRGAVIAALKGDAALMERLNGLFDGAPERASTPYGVVGECLGADWGAKELDGCEVRVSISLFDAGETPGRLGAMIARIDPALRAAAGVDGWRIVTARLARSRVAKDGARPGGWQAVVDYRIRAVREGA